MTQSPISLDRMKLVTCQISKETLTLPRKNRKREGRSVLSSNYKSNPIIVHSMKYLTNIIKLPPPPIEEPSHVPISPFVCDSINRENGLSVSLIKCYDSCHRSRPNWSGDRQPGSSEHWNRIEETDHQSQDRNE